jgi:hypothetical protein
MAIDPEHPHPTRRSGYRYFFASKHHGAGTSEDAQWSKDITALEEFTVFDEADFRDISDERAWLYGVLRGADGKLRDLGIWQEQIAEFPHASEGTAWHGYPVWAINKAGPSNRKIRPAKEVFQKMEANGLINRRERKRLFKGDHA